jgi:hypothetical protein
VIWLKKLDKFKWKFIQLGRNKNSLPDYLQNENHETRLCGNERLKDEFFDDFSVDWIFVFVVTVDVEEEVDDVDDGIGLLISRVVELLNVGDIDRVNGDDGDRETENGEGRDRIE